MRPLPIMKEDEIARCEIVADEAGFGAMETQKGNLPLKGLDVDGTIVGLAARITMRQTYVNAFDGPLEATYIFPLPSRAAVVEFKMVVEGRIVDGVLKERGEARREYQEAIDAGQRASIVEEDRPDVFTMRAGNIAPGEEVTIELTMVMPLVWTDGEATLRFPLVVAPRYIPGQALDGASVGEGVAPDTHDVPDASRITPPTLLPGFPNPVSLKMTFTVDRRAAAITNLRSSLHTIQKSESDGQTTLSIEPGERVNRDFILRFDVAEDEVSAGLMTVPDEGDEGTFFATLLPGTTRAPSRPRDIVFVLDRSGSMGGWKMVAARRALGRMVDTLSSDDRFGLIAFDTRSESPDFSEGLTEASNRMRYKAIEWLSTIDARGGTEMAEPIFEALDRVGSDADRDQAVVLVTDGQVGNEDQILRGVNQRLGSTSFFTVGIDQAVNAGFLTRLADMGRGQCELVESEDRLDDVMDRLHQTLDTPVMTEVRLTLEGAEAIDDSVVPDRAATLFAATPLTISGRYRRTKGPMRAIVSGANASGENVRHELEAHEVDDSRFAAIWARRRVRSLEDKYAAGQTGPDVRKAIIDTSLKFGVLCRFTSFVAVDRDGDTVTGESHEVVQPVETPQGWVGQGAQAMPMSAPAPRSAPMAKRSRGGSIEGQSSFSGAPPVDSLTEYDVSDDYELSAEEAVRPSPQMASRTLIDAGALRIEIDVTHLASQLRVLLSSLKSIPSEIIDVLEKAERDAASFDSSTDFANALFEACTSAGIDPKSADVAAALKSAGLGAEPERSRSTKSDHRLPAGFVSFDTIAAAAQPLPLDVTIRLVIDACLAIEDLHARGMLFVDSKQTLVVDEGRTRLSGDTGQSSLLGRIADFFRRDDKPSERSESFWK